MGRENPGAIQLYYEDHGQRDPVVLVHAITWTHADQVNRALLDFLDSL